MGYLQSLFRILGRRDEEDSRRPNYPYTPHHHGSGDSDRLPKMSIFRKFFGILFRKVRSLFHRRASPRKIADPILPTENPNNSPSLHQKLLISNTDDHVLHPNNFVVCVEEIIAQRKDDRVEGEGGRREEKNIDVDEGKWIQNPDNGPSLRQNVLIINTDDHGFHPDNFVVCVEEIAQQNNDIFVEEEEKLMIKSVNVNEGKWIKHYSSRHRILIVGDGDFSFSAALAIAFGCASNMIATTLDSKAFLKKHYQNARANMEKLKNTSCKVLHGVDATKMANHALLRYLTFDRIIFNFPFAGFFKHLSRETQLKRHRRLVSLFMKNAREMISENGEIHISHKTNEFHIEWKLEMLASSHRLRLIEAVGFDQLDYLGYNTKCGFGTDNNFNCYPSKTYKFGHKRGVRCKVVH